MNQPDQTVPTGLAWHSSPALKAEVMGRLHAHRAEDSIVQQTYQDVATDLATGFRGCAIGCTLPLLGKQSPFIHWHLRVEMDYGIHQLVAALIDWTFEQQETFEEAADFAVAVIDAIPVGADLSGVDAAWDAAAMDYAAPDREARWLIDTLTNTPVPAAVGVPE